MCACGQKTMGGGPGAELRLLGLAAIPAQDWI